MIDADSLGTSIQGTMKQITVHGPKTMYCLTAWLIKGANDQFYKKAGFGGTYIAIVNWQPDPELYLDNPKGHAPHATKSRCPILNAAVHQILHNWEKIPNMAHIEVEETSDGQFDELPVTVKEGLKVK